LGDQFWNTIVKAFVPEHQYSVRAVQVRRYRTIFECWDSNHKSISTQDLHKILA